MKRAFTIILTMIFMLSILVVPASAAITIDSLNASINNQTKVVTVEGVISSGPGQQVTLTIVDPEGNLEYLNQKESGEGGSFNFTYTMKNNRTGEYAVTVGGMGVADLATTTFIYNPTSAPSSNADLSNLVLSGVTINFDSAITSYTVNVANSVSSITVTPTTADTGATIKVNGTVVTSGSASGPISLSVGANTITILVTAEDEITTKTYIVTVNRASATTGGGGGGATTPTTPTEPTTTPTPPEEKTVSLTDISGHWAEAYIDRLIAIGAITGYPDNTFRPNNNITRAEFATILVRAFGLEVKPGKVFNDTANHWAKDIIATAAAHGIVTGLSETTFGPNELITREQMAAMIVRAANLSLQSGDLPFADSFDLSSWAVTYVATAVKEGLITGYPDNTFKPKGNATRAEAATVIIKAINN